MDSTAKNRRAVIFGLDGATFDVILPLTSMGLLPNLSAIMRTGSWGKLRSTIHPVTPQAWTTFLTGKNAGKHGIYDFTTWKEGSYTIDFVNASHRKAPTIFTLLSRKGKKVGSVAVPFTYPPEKVKGFMLSGIDAPDESKHTVYPETLFNELRRDVGPYYIHKASPVGRQRNVNHYLKDILTEDENRTEIAQYLMKRHPTDLFMVVYNNIDRIQHQTLSQNVLEEIQRKKIESQEAKVLVEVYRETDEKVGRLLDHVKEQALLIVMSDHGSGPIRKIFYLNQWLEKNGWLTFRTRSDTPLYHKISGMRALAKRILPRWGKSFIKSRFSGLRDRIETYLAYSDIDWEKTRAYGFGLYGNICINLRGREPEGIVDPGREYKELREEIREELESLQDPESAVGIVDKVWKREDIYSGPYVGKSPDLIIRWKDYAYYTSIHSDTKTDGFFGPPQYIDSSAYRHVGTHRLEGIFMAAGQEIKKGARLESVALYDIVPTLLYYLDMPIPDDLDGSVLKEIFTPVAVSKRSALSREKPLPEDTLSKSTVQYSQEEASQVFRRLRALGYFD